MGSFQKFTAHCKKFTEMENIWGKYYYNSVSSQFYFFLLKLENFDISILTEVGKSFLIWLYLNRFMEHMKPRNTGKSYSYEFPAHSVPILINTPRLIKINISW